MITSPVGGRHIDLRSPLQPDTSSRGELEQALSLLSATLESTADGILVVDRAGMVSNFNKRLLSMWNVPESLMSHSLDVLIAHVLPGVKNPKQFLGRFAADLADSPADESIDVVEFRDGRVFERYSRPHMLGGECVGRVWSFRDVSEHHRSQVLLMEREHRFRSLFADNPVPMWVYHLDTLEVVEVNEAAVQKYGYSREEFLGMKITALRVDADADVAENRGSKGLDYDIAGVWRHRTKGGRILNVKVNSHTIEFDGQIAALVLAQDVTELVGVQRALRESESRVREEASRTAALLKVANRLNAQLDVQSVLKAVCQETRRALRVPAVSVLLYDEKDDVFVTSATLGLPDAYSEQHRPVGRELYEKYVRPEGGQIFSVSDVKMAPYLTNSSLYESLGIRTIVSASMTREGTMVGAIVAFSLDQPRSFSSEELTLLKGLADHTAQAVANARYFGEFQRTTFELALAYDTTLEGWSRALDLRDRETEGHCRRVSDLAVRLGHAMGESPETLVNIRRGSLLHDIGKMAIPDRILLKSGDLSEDEWQIMRRHPEYALTLLGPIPYLKSALDIPYAHHERWDGTGYPRGLRGPEIPRAARIFAVTDVWDSLRSDRPYRKAWSAARVREHIRSLASAHFDPIAVEAFLDLDIA